jgi:hypothetical protein
VPAKAIPHLSPEERRARGRAALLGRFEAQAIARQLKMLRKSAAKAVANGRVTAERGV